MRIRAPWKAGGDAEPGTPGFSPDHVPVGSPAVLVQPHCEGSLLGAPDLDIPCFEPVGHSLDGESREKGLRAPSHCSEGVELMELMAEL